MADSKLPSFLQTNPGRASTPATPPDPIPANLHPSHGASEAARVQQQIRESINRPAQPLVTPAAHEPAIPARKGGA